MRKAERGELKPRELPLDAFDLLQAEHVGPRVFGEAAHEIEPKPDRVDVPSGKAKAHGNRKLSWTRVVDKSCAGARWGKAPSVFPRRSSTTEAVPTVKKAQTRGESGLLRVPYGGNLWWGGKTHHRSGISLI